MGYSGNRETAFVTATTSAGIVHAITKACSVGNLTECSCSREPAIRQRFIGDDWAHSEDNTIRSPANYITHTPGRVPPSKAFSWGGCSDDTSFAITFARRFLDTHEHELFKATGDVLHLMNAHNNFVGREAITQNMRRRCRCHGVSGSCEFQTCWLEMPKFSEVGEMLKQRYNYFAVQVAKKSKKRLRRKDRTERKIPLRGNEMAYINKSPNYCERNDTL
ncbi:EGL-20 protein, partial [Aphelenchoides avenae]